MTYRATHCFQKQIKVHRTLHWLLEDPLVYGGRLDISVGTVFTLSRALATTGIITLSQLVEITGTELPQAEDLVAHLILWYLHVNTQLLCCWKSSLRAEEQVQLSGYKNDTAGPAEEETFLQLSVWTWMECRTEKKMNFKICPANYYESLY